MPSYGYNVIGTVGSSIQLIASDFSDVLWKPGGITVDWGSVVAVAGADVTLTNGTVIKIGQKYIPLGTIMARITSAGANQYKYRPSLTNSADGSQTLARGYCYLLNEDISENSPLGLVQGNASDHPGAFNEGTIWRARLHVGGTNEQTLASFITAFPGINFADM